MTNAEVKIYHVCETGLAEGTALGRTSVVLSADFYRLTAERDGLLAKLETMRRKNNELNDTEARLTAEIERLQDYLGRAEAAIKRSVMVEDYDALQSELTKARELLECLMRHPAVVAVITRPIQKAIREALATHITHNVAESCKQDVEAAKGGYDV